MPKPRKLSPRKAPSQQRSRETVEAIIQATTYILSRSGYESLTTNRVATRAGVNIATLYQYFANKESLLVEVLRRHVVETRAAALCALKAQRGRGLKDNVRAQVAATVAAHQVAPALHRVLTEQASRLGLPPIHTDYDAELKREQAQGVQRGALAHPELALWIAQTAVHAVVHQACIARPELLGSQAFVDELTILTTRYLRRT